MQADRIIHPPQPNIVQWQDQQESLAQLLEEWGAIRSSPKIDWQRGLIFWFDEVGDTVARARAKALCSYDRDEQSLLMAWSNDDARGNAVVAAVRGVPALIERCSEEAAWLWAMHIAEERGALYLYRYASGSYLVFLGLWSIELLVEDDLTAPETAAINTETSVVKAQTPPLPSGTSNETPDSFAIELLDELREMLRKEPDAAVIRRAFLNRAQAFLVNAQALIEDGADPALLRDTEEQLRSLSEGFGQRRFGLLPAPHLDDAEREVLNQELLTLQYAWDRNQYEGHPPTAES